MLQDSFGRNATRLAKLLVDISWWLAICGGVILVVLTAFWPLTTPEGLDQTVRAEVSISDEIVRERLPVSATGDGIDADVELEQVRGSLELRPTLWRLILLRGLVAAAGLGFTLAGLRLMRSFLRDVHSAEVFTPDNAARLTRLAWVLIIAGLTLPLLDFAYSVVLLRYAQLAGTAVGLSVRSLGTVIPGLLVLVVAAAWQYGVELQREQDLTI